jgi:cobalt/nickel transport protein
MMKRNTFIIIGIVVVLIIAILAPFISSNNPDGLESTFNDISGSRGRQGLGEVSSNTVTIEENLTNITGNNLSFHSLFPDYSIGNLAKFGEPTAIVMGTFLILLLAFGVGTLLKRRKD